MHPMGTLSGQTTASAAWQNATVEMTQALAPIDVTSFAQGCQVKGRFFHTQGEVIRLPEFTGAAAFLLATVKVYHPLSLAVASHR